MWFPDPPLQKGDLVRSRSGERFLILKIAETSEWQGSDRIYLILGSDGLPRWHSCWGFSKI